MLHIAIMKDLRAAINETMDSTGENLTAFCRRAGVKPPCVCRYLRDPSRDMKLSTYEKISAALKRKKVAA